nr:DUF1735 domain-containing protein [Pedobacter sp. ASV2]
MKIYKLFITGAIMTTILSSCLKNKFDYINPSGSVPVVEFKNPGAPSSESPEGAIYTVFPVAYASGATFEATYTVQLTGPAAAPQDVTVNIGTKGSAVTEFNASKANVASYVPYVELPSSLYTISNPTVTIPAGQNTATVKVVYKTSSFNFAAKYALPLSITSTNYAGISKNFGTILLNVAAKNTWDGIYSMQAGSAVQRYSAPGVPTVGDALNGSMAGNPDITLTSINGTTVEITNLRWQGGASSIAGIDNLQAVIDPATNLVTMKSLGNATLKNIPGKDNKYDPTTKTFTLNFDWNQTTAPREVSLVVKYKGSR